LTLTTMRQPIDRLTLARTTYRDALGAARARSTPGTWRRLLRAHRNLRDAEATARPPPAPARAARRTVLLVEDERDTRDALCEALVRRGLTVWTAEDAPSALDFLRQAPRPPAAILLDLVLPGMSGWELRARLLGDRRTALIPVIAMSGARGAQVTGVPLLEKPVDLGDLVRTLDRVAGAR
jgi:CheY-like chemotaxis protein